MKVSIAGRQVNTVENYCVFDFITIRKNFKMEKPGKKPKRFSVEENVCVIYCGFKVMQKKK